MQMWDGVTTWLATRTAPWKQKIPRCDWTRASWSLMGIWGKPISRKRMYERAIEEFRTAGKKEQAQEILSEFLHAPKGQYTSPYDWAMIYAGMGDKQKTLAWLDKAYDERNGRIANLAVHPQFAFLRGTPGFQALLKRMGLPTNKTERKEGDPPPAQ